MKKGTYLFDTHALIFWNTKECVSEEFIKFFDTQEQRGKLLISSISFWEIALLVKKGKIEISNMHAWKKEILNYTNIRMIDSTLLPDHHKDPFDRLLIAQAKNRDVILVTKDVLIQQYPVTSFWI